MMLKRGVFALIAISAMTGAAAADCRIIAGRFSLAQNTAVSTTGVSTRGAACGIKFASASMSHFSSATVATRPRHGALREFGAMSFVYKPTTGFKGIDSFTLRICGTDPAGSGCATLTYNITIE